MRITIKSIYNFENDIKIEILLWVITVALFLFSCNRYIQFLNLYFFSYSIMSSLAIHYNRYRKLAVKNNNNYIKFIWTVIFFSLFILFVPYIEVTQYDLMCSLFKENTTHPLIFVFLSVFEIIRILFYFIIFSCLTEPLFRDIDNSPY